MVAMTAACDALSYVCGEWRWVFEISGWSSWGALAGMGMSDLNEQRQRRIVVAPICPASFGMPKPGDQATVKCTSGAWIASTIVRKTFSVLTDTMEEIATACRP